MQSVAQANSDRKVAELQARIKRSNRHVNAGYELLFDPAADPRHLEVVMRYQR